MSFAIQATPAALRSIDELRRKARESFDQKLKEIAARGCEALDYRLTGVGPHWLCAAHLYGDYRLIVALLDERRIVVLLVGRHRRDHGSDVYRLVMELLELPVPTGPRKKPPCCGKPVDSELDEAALEELKNAAEQIAGRLPAKTRNELLQQLREQKLKQFFGGTREWAERERRAHRG